MEEDEGIAVAGRAQVPAAREASALTFSIESGVMVMSLMARSSSRALRKPTKPTSTGSENSVDQGPVAGSIVHVETGGPVRPNCSENGNAPGRSPSTNRTLAR